MGLLGTFLRGAVTGIVGLGVLSWLITTCRDDEKANESESDEEDASCCHWLS